MVVCLYNPAPQSYLFQRFAGKSTMERIVDYVAQLRAAGIEVQAVSFYSTCDPGELPPDWKVEIGPRLDEQGVLDLLAEAEDPAGRQTDDELLFALADQPFLNAELTIRLVARHREYIAQYTFADGYPAGLAPEIVARSAVPHLRTLAGTDAVGRGGLFAIVQKDINRLDVETELSAVDQRLLRLELAVNTRANALLCERLASDAPSGIDEWPAHVEERRLSHRTLPSFVSVQVLEREVQRLAYSPYPRTREDVLAPGSVMDEARFRELVAQIDRFAPEAVVHLSLWGEIALHPRCSALIDAVLATESLTLLVETSGVGWSSDARSTLFGLDSPRLMVIVGLDTDDRTLYEQIRGQGFDEAQAFAREAVERLGSRAWVQAVRSELTEPALEGFYRGWSALTSNVIIEKYDHFSGRLPGLKIGDISPLRRFPCWHLQRDMYVLVDGTVPLCREDVDRAHVQGNVFEDGIEATWARAHGRFTEHVDGTYRTICEACDEFYTYTF